jgi:hypothetical protein
LWHKFGQEPKVNDARIKGAINKLSTDAILGQFKMAILSSRRFAIAVQSDRIDVSEHPI